MCYVNRERKHSRSVAPQKIEPFLACLREFMLLYKCICIFVISAGESVLTRWSIFPNFWGHFTNRKPRFKKQLLSWNWRSNQPTRCPWQKTAGNISIQQQIELKTIKEELGVVNDQSPWLLIANSSLPCWVIWTISDQKPPRLIGNLSSAVWDWLVYPRTCNTIRAWW